MPDYSYQDRLCRDVYASLTKHPKTVLAASCAAGKTRMAIRVIKRFRSEGKRVLVLTHGQTILRSQFVEAAKERKLSVIELSSAPTSLKKLPEKSVVVCIPHAFSRMDQTKANQFFKQFDLLVIDEAHHFYLAETVEQIKKASNAKHLLLTASPSRFIKLNKRYEQEKIADHFNIVFFSTEELLKHKVIESPTIALGLSDYTIREEDFNEELNVTDMKSTLAESETTLNFVRESVLEHCEMSKNTQWTGITKKREKILMIANNITQAKDLLAGLRKRKVRAEISTSQDDLNSKMVASFKEPDSFEVLVVVGRARLGFNFPELTTIIDISGTLNPDGMFQMMNRVTRRYTMKKLYLKIMPQNMQEHAVNNLNFTIALISPEIFKTYHGGYRKLRPTASGTKKSYPHAQHIEKTKKAAKTASVNYGLIPTFEIMSQVSENESFRSSIEEALELKKKNKGRYPSIDEAYEACRKLNITTQHQYAKLRKQDPMLPGKPSKVYDSWSFNELKD